ncbi:MAG: PIN domain-containing protein [Verrucomicrobiaceae bacterium]|nr:MAG: PIN domain-containing protein [Verrucomicrobiaceae bacterium]
MILFLDTSVLLAASGSATGAARFICSHGALQGWTLITSGYCIQETLRNLAKIGPEAPAAWEYHIQPTLQTVPDTFGMGKQALVFPKAKDRPVVIAALAARATVLLTLDRTDFHGALGPQVYGMSIRTPGDFLMELRRKGGI